MFVLLRYKGGWRAAEVAFSQVIVNVRVCVCRRCPPFPYGCKMTAPAPSIPPTLEAGGRDGLVCSLLSEEQTCPETCSALPYLCLWPSLYKQLFQPLVRKVSVLCCFIRWSAAAARGDRVAQSKQKFVILTGPRDRRHSMQGHGKTLG